MANLLIKNGVNINQLTKDGSTPLSWAAYWGKLNYINSFKIIMCNKMKSTTN